MPASHHKRSRIVPLVTNNIRYSDAMRKVSTGAILLFGGEPWLEDSAELKRHLSYLPNAVEVGRALNDMRLILAYRIDDHLDAMSPETLIALGDVKTGATPSPFLQNLLTKDDWAVFKRITDAKLLPEADLMVFGNLFAQQHVNEAKAALALRNDPTNTTLRDTAAHEHLRSSELCAILLTNVYKHKIMTLPDDAEYATLASKNDKSVHIGRILGCYDDTQDFFIDYAQEKRTGNPTSNVLVAAFMHEIAELTPKAKADAIARLDTFVDRAVRLQQRVQLSQMPPELQHALYAVVKKSESEALALRGENPTRWQEHAYDFCIDMMGALLKHGWYPKPALADARGL